MLEIEFVTIKGLGKMYAWKIRQGWHWVNELCKCYDMELLFNNIVEHHFPNSTWIHRKRLGIFLLYGFPITKNGGVLI